MNQDQYGADNTEVNGGNGPDSAEARNSDNGFNLMGEVFDWTEAVVYSLVTVILVFTFIFRTVWVEGPSMMNTLKNQDRVVISSLGYTPKPLDIVVVNAENPELIAARPDLKNKPLIKRIIAVEGQTIDFDIQKHQVIVDGKVLDEPYIREEMLRFGDSPERFPLKVPKGQVFVMGDNRNDSFDSRYALIGTIDKHRIIGKVVFRIYPFDKIGAVDRFKTA